MVVSLLVAKGWRQRSLLPQQQRHLSHIIAAGASNNSAAARLGTSIPLELHSYDVAGRELLLLLPEVEAVMAAYSELGQVDRAPCWCEPWPCALAMAEEVLRRPELVAGKRVAELGCGLGLPGIAAAAAGAAHVMLLDREPLALVCALLSAKINGLPVGSWLPETRPAPGAGPQTPATGTHEGHNTTQLAPDAGRASVCLPEEVQKLLEQVSAHPAPAPAGACHELPGGAVSALVYDWNQPAELAARADVLLACDVLYEACSVQAVAAVAPRLLAQEGGTLLLLADAPNRTPHNRARFLRQLTKRDGGCGFAVVSSKRTSVRVWEDVPATEGGVARSSTGWPGGCAGGGQRQPQLPGLGAEPGWREMPVALLTLRRGASATR